MRSREIIYTFQEFGMKNAMGKSATCSPGKSETPGRCCDGVNPG